MRGSHRIEPSDSVSALDHDGEARQAGRIVERWGALGSVSTDTGTIPAKTIRAAIRRADGQVQRAVYGGGYRIKSEITSKDVRRRTHRVIELRGRIGFDGRAVGIVGGTVHRQGRGDSLIAIERLPF